MSKFDPGTPCLLSLPLHQSGPGRKHMAFSKGSLRRACTDAGRVKGTYEGWWGTRGPTAIGSCFVTTSSLRDKGRSSYWDSGRAVALGEEL